ncbi:predicted protein [Histoplasma mississippiense (nom. inval.)]|uniref:predicted protein n=1 Tax=Ajellomyces capsulatus (strain NAm1 / WU24) TaxID=2059318 RepID=UPI000157C0F9|nr:predicted protein [Histoplasma mississippiense (nom. inval.)]EDN06681.1 predicted protein [Histoplasma mississippiense (nom. inval.)]
MKTEGHMTGRLLVAKARNGTSVKPAAAYVHTEMSYCADSSDLAKGVPNSWAKLELDLSYQSAVSVQLNCEASRSQGLCTVLAPPDTGVD